MNREKKRLKLPLIVEGRYDKCTLSSLFEGLIIPLDGFSVFNSKEKQALIRKISENGVILLTDSDGGGRQLRSFVSGLIPPERINHLYIPKIQGKEKRKVKSSKEGYLGVEGMEPELLLKILAPFTEDGERVTKISDLEITVGDFFEDGFTGSDNSSARREALAEHFGLPADISAKSLIKALNLISSYEEYKKYVNDNLQNDKEEE